MKSSALSEKETNFTSTGNFSVTDEKVIRVELLFSGFICEHNLLIARANYVGKLLKTMFPDSNIAKKYYCSRKKTINILPEVVAKELLFDLKSTLSSSDLHNLFVLITDGSRKENYEFLPILDRSFATNGLARTSLIDIPNIDKGSDSHCFKHVLSR